MAFCFIKVVTNMVISRQIYGFRGTDLLWIRSDKVTFYVRSMNSIIV